MAAADISVERLRELLEYNAETGVITWRRNRGRALAGCPAGAITRLGYVDIQIEGNHAQAHRVAWALHFGAWPEKFIDHIDGARANNKIGNLREVTALENNQNQRRAQRNNKSSGLLGVSKNNKDKTWIAKIRVNGKVLHIGRFAEPSEAHQAYLEAKRRLHAGCMI